MSDTVPIPVNYGNKYTSYKERERRRIQRENKQNLFVRFYLKPSLVLVGSVMGIATITVLVKKNQKLNKDLNVALGGYLTLANELAIEHGYTLGDFLNKLEKAGS